MSEKPKVLVVDDDPDVVDQLAVTLQGAGYEVHTGSSQKEAEELLLSVRPDVAILDLMMEQMDSGFVICHYLKGLYPDTPVILLTAVTAATGLSFTTPSAEAQSWVKADLVLDKPVRPEQIRAEVRRLLHQEDVAEAAKKHAH
jgi:two-component system alkaline phosphatase synthesis response regulator PhoP